MTLPLLMVLVGKIALNAMNESIPIHHENLCQICNNLAYDHPNLNGSFKCVVPDNPELFKPILSFVV